MSDDAAITGDRGVGDGFEMTGFGPGSAGGRSAWTTRPLPQAGHLPRLPAELSGASNTLPHEHLTSIAMISKSNLARLLIHPSNRRREPPGRPRGWGRHSRLPNSLEIHADLCLHWQARMPAPRYENSPLTRLPLRTIITGRPVGVWYSFV